VNGKKKTVAIPANTTATMRLPGGTREGGGSGESRFLETGKGNKQRTTGRRTSLEN
jgi:hypothetical protein